MKYALTLLMELRKQVPTTITLKGGPGSGHHGHAGRLGKRGGSLPGTGGGFRSPSAANVPSDVIEALRREPHALEAQRDRSEDPRAFEFVTNEAMRIYAAPEEFGFSREDLNHVDVRVTLKEEIVWELSDETGIPEEKINEVIKQWAGTANDNDMRSLSMQEAVSEEFGVESGEWQKDSLTRLYPAQDDALEEMIEIFAPFTDLEEAGRNRNPDLFGLLPRNQERTLLRTMYENTQEAFARQGFKPEDTITLFRGYKRDGDLGLIAGEVIDYHGNAMESWSSSLMKAGFFAYAEPERTGVIVAIEVPVRNILSTAVTGYGCLSEEEFLTFGTLSDMTARVVSTSYHEF